MAWIYLFIAGLMEIGWPLGLKFSQTQPGHRIGWIIFAILSMTASGIFLWIAQKTIPMGTAYAIWTGMGAVGAFLLGILLFRDPASFFRIASATLIVLGVIGLKLSSN
ncbi:MAG: multidrug efflux SMR transporter [Bacteroidetes bacterium]|nr:multidrug efflux SMR transporter [Bacteroidota bacterium]